MTRLEAQTPTATERPPTTSWMELRPFLDQPRAHGALRKELDALCEELEPSFDVDSAEHTLELIRLPFRVLARFDEFGVSFSWIGARNGNVADGCLMVIEWNRLDSMRGPDAMKTARPVRECLYMAEATGAADWRWRRDSLRGHPSSTADLAAEWGASISAAPHA